MTKGSTRTACDKELTDVMQLLQSFVNSFVHNLRSSLSVAKGVLSDKENGFTVVESEYRDAHESINKSLKTMDNVISIVNGLPVAFIGEFCLYDLIEGLDFPLCATPRYLDKTREIISNQVNLSLVRYAIYCVDIFVRELTQHYSSRNVETKYYIEYSSNCVYWTIHIAGVNFSKYSTCAQLSHLALQVHSPSSLSLFMAEMSMIINGFQSKIDLTNDGFLCLELLFDNKEWKQ